MNSKELNRILKPCSNRSYGGFYTLLVLAVGAVVLTGWLLVQLFKATVKLCEVLNNYYNKNKVKKQVKKAVVKAQMSELEMFGRLENCLMKNNNIMYYTIKGYSNKDDVLKRFIDFRVSNENGELECVNMLLGKYLIRSEFKVKYAKRGNNKGSVVMENLDQLEMEQAFKELYGCPINFVELDKDCLSFLSES